MNWFSSLYQRVMIKRHAKKLAGLLQQRYGRSVAYTEPQIRKTMEVHHLPPHYLGYSLGLFLSQKAWLQVQTRGSQTANYSGVQQDLEDWGLVRPDSTWEGASFSGYGSDSCFDSFGGGGFGDGGGDGGGGGE